jgi:hypothetical protein
MIGLEKLIADALQESDRTTIEEAIEEAEEELDVRQRSVSFDRLIIQAGTDDEENLLMPMSTRHSGRIYLMSIQNHINVMVVIDIFPQRTPSSLRPMYIFVSP